MHACDIRPTNVAQFHFTERGKNITTEQSFHFMLSPRLVLRGGVFGDETLDEVRESRGGLPNVAVARRILSITDQAQEALRLASGRFRSPCSSAMPADGQHALLSFDSRFHQVS